MRKLTDEEFKDKLIADMLEVLEELASPLADSPHSWYQERAHDFRSMAQRNVSYADEALKRFKRRIKNRLQR